MAFLIGFGEDGPNLDVITTDSRAFVVSAIGFDEERGESFVMHVSLDTNPTVGGHELSFCLVGTDENDRETPYWDGSETSFIRPPFRDLILQTVVVAARALVAELRPERIWLVTQGTNLPVRALRKYQTINRMLATEGYDIQDTDYRYGVHTWILTRSRVA